MTPFRRSMAVRRWTTARNSRVDLETLSVSALECLSELYELEVGVVYGFRSFLTTPPQYTVMFEASEVTQWGAAGPVLDAAKALLALPQEGWRCAPIEADIVRTAEGGELRKLRAGLTKGFVFRPADQEWDGCTEAFLDQALVGPGRLRELNRVQLASLLICHHVLGADSVEPGELRVCEAEAEVDTAQGRLEAGKLYFFCSARLPYLQPTERARAPLLVGYSARVVEAMQGALRLGHFDRALLRVDKHAARLAVALVGHGFTDDPVEAEAAVRARVRALGEPVLWSVQQMSRFVLRRYRAARLPVCPPLLETAARGLEAVLNDKLIDGTIGLRAPRPAPPAHNSPR